MPSSDDFHLHGQLSRGFEAVRQAFAENFRWRHELGRACCAFYCGEKVVDLWGGIRNQRWLDYEARVCSYWPARNAAGV
jgi:hypothetical protein